MFVNMKKERMNEKKNSYLIFTQAIQFVYWSLRFGLVVVVD